MPRYILFIRASTESEAGIEPTTQLFEAMAAYNASMVEAGILLAGEGLLPSSKDSRRLTFHDGKEASVVEGPFDVKEIVGGWWIIKVNKVEEAVEWAKKCPEMKEGNVIEIRRIADMDDFGDAFGEDLKEKESEMRKQIEECAKKI